MNFKWRAALQKQRLQQGFVAVHGQLQDKWNEVIADTIEGNVLIEKTAAKIDVNLVTAFRMRHKPTLGPRYF